jgi:hypothetical protein
MNFWQQIQNAAEMGRTLPWLILIFVIASVILFAVRPNERQRIQTALLLFGLALAGLLVEATLLSNGFTRADSAYKWVRWSWRILLAIAFVNVSGALSLKCFWLPAGAAAAISARSADGGRLHSGDHHGAIERR